ncbi:hypothetical protein E2C01_093520 [Portunus trituberculatus]|uniref:Uncharacterized protein n=1 Tax=Portunus trituberculatus TaxID=210409 RepID=A0A5B7JYH1_PORTR|nr:hypothetical protein [Portunus trituberculatus]
MNVVANEPTPYEPNYHHVYHALPYFGSTLPEPIDCYLVHLSLVTSRFKASLNWKIITNQQGSLHSTMLFMNDTEMAGSGDSPLVAEDDSILNSNESYQRDIDEMCLETFNTTMPTPRLMRFVVYGVLLTSVGLLGLAGNFISITILSRWVMVTGDWCG